MNYFLDTSALFKLFVHEDLSEYYLSVLQDDPSICVSSLSWVEFHSALRRRAHSKGLSKGQRDGILERFKKDWNAYVKVRVSDAVLESAARLVEIHSLKTLDSIQLACALDMAAGFQEPLAFLTADHALQTAARAEKLQTQI